MKQIVIGRTGGQTRIAILEEGKLVELMIESLDQALLGNVYRARVADVVAGMQAAFVDIGIDQNAYLYIDDISLEQIGEERKEQANPKPGIRQLVQRGAQLLVQVSKEGIGSKAPRVTTKISLPGRTLVYLPHGGQVAVSRRIRDERVKERLVNMIGALLGDGEGAILRTTAADASEQQIATELSALRQTWMEALERTKDVKPPHLVHQAADVVLRTVRDQCTVDVDEVVVEDASTYRRIKQDLSAFSPELTDRIRLYQGKQPLFQALGIDVELDKALRRQVWLKNGGFIVLDQTEAMTVIDVNTGKFTGKSAQQLEETVTAANLEAASEIARQIRLRDIAGIIIIDFIDMKAEANRARVLEHLQQQLANDRTSTYVCGFTRLGLLEMTRKRVRPSLGEALTVTCPVCSGRGRVLSAVELARRLEEEVSGLAKSQEAEAVVVQLPALLFEHFLAGEKAEWHRLERELMLKLYLHKTESISPDQYRILYVGSEKEASRWQKEESANP
ncbi:Rne/Rng family ribonuclease [Brevibacillus humidisoli]|uniref:Rne/Rng family ribonuclease n=1 Tax=Brevibacillus humidisoli TaxID=2895522 RepID=UPI001E37C3EC|nr:Rne/Rng family ribonuclease [Brevibacillus humidisoli]UFJ39046.1 Rne/Rng family ribonuclease [Brevibacillus humidisoli]